MGRHLQLWRSDLIQFNFHWQMGRHLQLWCSDLIQFNFHWQMGRHLQLWRTDLIQFNFHWQMGRHLQLWCTGEPDLGPPKVRHLWAGGHEALLSLPEWVVLPQVGNIFELCVMINLTWFSWWGPVQTMWGRKVTWDEQLVLQEPVFFYVCLLLFLLAIFI